MSISTRKLKPLLKTPGGKWYQHEHIIANMPAHAHYYERFAGGLSILLNKPRPSGREVVIERDPLVCNFHRVVQGRPMDLLELVSGVEYCERTFRNAMEFMGSGSNPDWSGYPDPLMAAIYLTVNAMSRGGMGKTFAWSDRLRGGRPGDVNAWHSRIGRILAVSERLQGVEIRHGDALETFDETDDPEILLVDDPPYCHETRTSKNLYSFEMSDADHRRLIGQHSQTLASVVLCGYANPMYDAALTPDLGWRRVEKDIANHSGQGKSKQRRTEVLWIKGSGYHG